jgi:hypothetical protein
LNHPSFSRGLLILLLLVTAHRANAQSTTSATHVDITGTSRKDAKLRAALEQRLTELQHAPLSAAQLNDAAVRAGALATGSFARDPETLERVRVAASATVVVRAYATGTTQGGTVAELSLIDAQGVRKVTGVITNKTAAPTLVSMLDAAWAMPATPIAGAPAAASALAPAAAAAAPAPVDTVILADKTELTGTIVQQQPGQFVIIQTRDGVQHTLAWNQLQRVVMAPRAAAGAAPLVSRDAANLDVTQGRASFSQQQGCPPGAPPEQCQSSLDANVDASAQQAQIQKTVDCAPGSTEERCREQMSASVGKGSGVSLEYSKEKVTAVKERPSGSVDVGIAISAQFGFSTGDMDATLAGAGVDLTLSFLTGPIFPGDAGGSWHGFFLDPKAGGHLMSMSAGEMSVFMTGFSGGASAGWQYLSFDKLEPKSLKQEGIGFRLGGYVGYQTLSGETEVAGQTLEFSNDSESYGPVIGFSQLSYNPGTADLSRQDLNVLILPTGDFVFIMIQGNFTF